MSCNRYQESILNQIDEYRRNNNVIKDEKVKPLSEYELKRLPKIPDDWVWMISNDVCTFITNGVHSPTNKEDTLGAGMKMLRITDIDENNNANFDNLPYCTRLISGDYEKKIKKDDIYISFTGNKLGKRYLAKKDFDDVVFAHYFVRWQPIVVNPKYIYYVVLSNHFERFMAEHTLGSAQPNLKVTDLKRVPLPIAPINEQNKIVNILSTLDEKIELNNEMNKTLEEMAQALFKRWFVDFEFPNEEGKPYKSSGGEMVESELGMIPKGWSYGIFSDISKRIYSGGTPNTKEESYWNGLLPWMSSGETRNSFVTNTEKSITELGVEKSSTKLANKYNTVIASAGQGFTRGQTSLLLIDTYVNQSLIVIDGCEEFELFNYINIKLRYNELRAISDSHSIRGSLTTKMISALGTIIPSIEILKKYNSIIKPIIDIIENNISNTNRLIKLRDSLLPKLMSGEITVDNVEIDI